ncbi:unnamed protein product [Oikopleura dioica]|uniref:FERM domain-containing protein n=1 Tax=Oikopleura dioica TaxID=34765 RepID=E4XE06_OIKDI|nr:unnamed protein product [Oikopleura dioica]
MTIRQWLLALSASTNCTSYFIARVEDGFPLRFKFKENKLMLLQDSSETVLILVTIL